MIKNEVAIFGGGCFWCTEAVYKILRGIESVVPGYAGGPSTGSGYKPTYEEVSTGTTGHAEVIKIEYDPEQISYRDLLTIFFATHDPTQLNRQGNDVGTQYRSIILHANNQQKEAKMPYVCDACGKTWQHQPSLPHPGWGIWLIREGQDAGKWSVNRCYERLSVHDTEPEAITALELAKKEEV